MQPPELLPEARQALDAWAYCGGWDPVRIPYAVEYLGIEDAAQLVWLLERVRDRIDAWQRAQRKAR